MNQSRGGIFSNGSIRSIVALAVIVIHLLAFKPAAGQDTADEQPPAPVAKQSFPDAQARIDHDVEILSKESTEETLSRLSQVDMYFWPGVPGEEPLVLGRPPFPVPSEPGVRDVQRLISCRRLVKAYQNLAALSKPEAATLVDRHLTIAVDEYKKLFEDCLKTQKPYTSPDKGYTSGPSFVIGGTDKPTLLGYRFQVLGLVFLAGNLELKTAAPSVLAVARQATEQYERMQKSDEFTAEYRASLVESGGLYSRQALAIGLIGTMANPVDPVATKYRQQMKVVKWPEFNAPVTPFDQPARWGGVRVKKKPLRFQTLGELSDEGLVEIVAAASGN
jgi:hypothetical protein